METHIADPAQHVSHSSNGRAVNIHTEKVGEKQESVKSCPARIIVHFSTGLFARVGNRKSATLWDIDLQEEMRPMLVKLIFVM